MKEMVGGCCVCSDERGWPDNPLVYCDGNGCTVAVHQACYGIVTVPTGPWYCRKCESPDTKGKVKCELCPSKSGALKRTDSGGWAHVVCALYIPEIRFGNVTSMEPIVLRLIPAERYNKQCYICQDSHKSHRASAGACMQCNKSGCKQQFHVTCAQSLGLLCEEAGNYLDNVKYCGYCQHHYSKLKKGGNVKTIPPYKPVVHDGQSSDSSGEKEGASSPLNSGAGTPTHSTKPKGLGRKSSHNASTSGKNTPNSSKTPTNTNPTSDAAEAIEPRTAGGRKHKSSDKNKKKSPSSRRGSSASEAGAGGFGSKNNTPTPSPQHSSDATLVAAPKGAGDSTPGGGKPAPAASPGPSKLHESAGVITSSALASTCATTTAPSLVTSPSLVQNPTPKPAYQESVITNTEAMETKQTKKRKAVSQANAIAQNAAQANASGESSANENHSQGTNKTWDGGHGTDIEMVDKLAKKAKTDAEAAHFSSVSPAPPPPPPVSQPSPRHSMSGASGVNPAPNIRSPAQPPGAGAGAKGEHDWPASLLVSVPLPSTSHGLNLTAHAHTQVSAASDISGHSSHVYHQPQKQTSAEPGLPGHSQHGGRSWGGLHVTYELQQDSSKPSVSGVGPSKEASSAMNGPPPPPPPPVPRNKKRAALAASMVTMANNALAASQAQAQAQAAAQSLASVRRQPTPTAAPVYQETIKDSPPSSPSSDRPLKPKMDTRMGPAPHMLGNELNPDSGAAARLQEQLNAELVAHAAGGGHADLLVPPPLINKAQPGSSGARGGSGAQSLDQLLERQWEQGSQFLMEQAQHFDIASLLSCLHQLRTENVRLEEHVGGLLQRRDHLLAVNARLAIPLTTATTAPPPEPSRCSRDSMPQPRVPPGAMRPPETVTSDRPHQLMMREVQQKPS